MHLFKKYFQSSVETINLNKSFRINKSLQKSQNFDFKIPDYEQMILDLKHRMDNHQALYKQYYI